MRTPLDTRWTGLTRAVRSPAALGRWSRDARTPSLRLRPPTTTGQVSETTARLPIVEVEHGARRLNWAHIVFRQPSEPSVRLRPIMARETMPFVGRQTACPYLEYRSSQRRCLSADPSPIDLERQVRYCLTSDHRKCKYYRKARGLRSVPPTQAAFYTAAAVTVILIVLAGLN